MLEVEPMSNRFALPVLGLIVLLNLPLTAAAAVMAPEAFAARLDELIEADWKAKGIKPAPLADDAEFLRRVYLDLTGRIPRVSEVHGFLADKSPDKRTKLVEALLENPRYVFHLGNTWRNLILPPSNNQQLAFVQPAFKNWMDKQVQDNIPFDKIVRDILTVPVFNGLGRGGFNPGFNNVMSPAAFYQANEFKAENLAASTSRLFLGVKLECAQCHDHPFAKWTKKQFWEYAAFFSGSQQPQFQPKIKGLAPTKFVPGREIAIPGTDKIAQARFLSGTAPEFENGLDSRVTLANWLTSPANPYFARTGINRLWAHFFGIGIVDPVDDEPTEENPPSHPELLAQLTQQFIAHQFDVKYMIRVITATRTYQRTSAITHPTQSEPRSFARMAVKGMTPEQLFDSLAQATGYQEQQPVGNQRFVVFGGQNNARAEFVQLFASQDKKTETHTSILQALALMNGKFISDATSLEKSRTLAAIVDAPFSNGQRIETLYLAALGRLPRPEESSRLLNYVNGGRDYRSALADVFWVLLNSSEFIFNH
jgi:hypothetical protein